MNDCRERALKALTEWLIALVLDNAMTCAHTIAVALESVNKVTLTGEFKDGKTNP